MFPRTTLVCLMAMLLCSTCWAKKHHHLDRGKFLQILEISPASVTVDAGKDVQESYQITGATRATLNGVPVKPEDLRAGMIASIQLAPDNNTVVSLAVKDAPRTVRKPKPPEEVEVFVR